MNLKQTLLCSRLLQERGDCYSTHFPESSSWYCDSHLDTQPHCSDSETTQPPLTVQVRVLNVRSLPLSFKEDPDVDSSGGWATTQESGWDLCADVGLICTKPQIQENLHWIFFPKFQPFRNAVVKYEYLYPVTVHLTKSGLFSSHLPFLHPLLPQSSRNWVKRNLNRQDGVSTRAHTYLFKGQSITPTQGLLVCTSYARAMSLFTWLSIS